MTSDLGGDALKVLRELVAEYETCEAQASEALKVAARAAERQREIAEQLLPDMMTELELKELTVANHKVEVKPFVNVSVNKEFKPQAMAWLVENGHSGLIKASLEVVFEKGDPAARALLESMKEEGYTVALDEGVHPQTLGKWGREVIEQGVNLPDCFTTFKGRKALIKKLKEQS